jgi:hypothetical protein
LRDPTRPRRRGGALLALALLVIAGVALAAFLLLDPGADDSGRLANPGTGPAAGSSDGASGGANDQPSGDAATSEAPSGEGSSTSAAPARTGGRTSFVEEYYGVLPDDTETGWSMLTPGFRSEVGSYDDYEGFWSSIDSVTVDDASPAGPDAVDVTLTYASGGGTEQEVRRISLERGADGYLISDDEVVG